MSWLLLWNYHTSLQIGLLYDKKIDHIGHVCNSAKESEAKMFTVEIQGFCRTFC